jgi:hypothetical protein
MFVDVKRILPFLSTSLKPISWASQKPNLGGVAFAQSNVENKNDHSFKLIYIYFIKNYIKITCYRDKFRFNKLGSKNILQPNLKKLYPSLNHTHPKYLN